MSNEQSVNDLFQTVQSTFNNIDILINNCGTWTLDVISKLENDVIDKHYNNILKSTILGTKYAAKYMNKGGVIINIGSFAGILSMKNASLYSSFKSAINTFTKSSAEELGEKSIRVNCVVPGVIRTPMTSQYIDDNYNKIIKPIALGRVGSCEEVANGVLFLCSDLASYITGVILEITGGKYATQL
jgi:NAD(P)-dependent dehydrogenase (short-subunit alcohol dehydrogenase family)